MRETMFSFIFTHQCSRSHLNIWRYFWKAYIRTKSLNFIYRSISNMCSFVCIHLSTRVSVVHESRRKKSHKILILLPDDDVYCNERNKYEENHIGNSNNNKKCINLWSLGRRKFEYKNLFCRRKSQNSKPQHYSTQMHCAYVANNQCKNDKWNLLKKWNLHKS